MSRWTLFNCAGYTRVLEYTSCSWLQTNKQYNAQQQQQHTFICLVHTYTNIDREKITFKEKNWGGGGWAGGGQRLRFGKNMPRKIA